MGRPIKFDDEGHKWHREQVAESRKKKKFGEEDLKIKGKIFDVVEKRAKKIE